MGLISAKTSTQVIRFVKSDSASRILGWFLLPLGSLGLLTDLETYGGINVAYGVLTAIALWLILRAAGIWDVSDSRELLMRHASSKHHAVHHHHKPKTQLFTKKQIRLIIFLLLLFGGACLSIGANLLLKASPSLFLVSIEGAALGMMLVTGGKRRGWFLAASAVAAAALLSSVTFLVPAEAYGTERLVSSYLAVAYLATVFYVVSGWRRTLENSRMGVTLISASAISYTALIGMLANYPLAIAWQVAFLSLAGVALCFAARAWVITSRLSFAKFFAAVSAVSMLFWAYLYLPDTLLILVLLVPGIVTLGVGVWLPSYTSRVAGTGLISLGTLHFLLLLQANPEPSVFGPIITSPTLWLAAIVLLVLGTAHWWYGIALPILKPKETLLQPVIRRAIATAAWGSILVLLVQYASGLAQTLLFVVWGIWLVALGKMHEEKMAVVAGTSAVVLAAFQFLAVDITTFSVLEQAIGFMGFAIVVLLLSLYVANHYLSHKKVRR
jgi:hypothetical protein